MATLSGQTIANTFDSILHVEDDTAGLVATSTDSRVIQDGVGANSALALATDSVRITSTNKLYFNDAGDEEIHSASDGHLEVNSGTTLDITAPTVDINASTAVTVDGSAITISKDTDAEFVASILVNQSDAADTTGIISQRFDLEDTGGNAVDSGKILVGKEASFTATGSTQDSYMALHTSLNGTLAEKMRIDSSGNVGIGAADPVTQLEIRGDASTPGATLTLSTADTEVVDGDILGRIDFRAPKEAGGTDAILAGASIWGEANDGFAADVNDTHIVFACNNSGATTSSQERMRIQGNGMVGIGTASPATTLDVSKTSAGGDVGITIHNTDNTTDSTDETCTLYGKMLTTATAAGKIVFARSSNYSGTGDKASKMHFYTADDGSDQLRMTIDKSGKVGIGTASPGKYLTVVNTGANWTVDSETSGTPGDYYSYRAYYSGASPDNNTSQFFEGVDSTTARVKIMADGDLQNHDNSYGALSDERIKQDISDASSQWDDIKALKVRKFKRKDDVFQYGDDAWEQIGVVAQEVEAAGMDKLVEHSPPSQFEIDNCGIDEDDKVKSMKYSILYMKAVKALQEAMERIESLESKVEALENA